MPSPELAAFSNLKSLFLNQNRLVGLPDCLGALVKLECLSVSYNFLESLLGVSFSRVFRVYGTTGPRLAGLRDPGPGPGLAEKAIFY